MGKLKHTSTIKHLGLSSTDGRRWEKRQCEGRKKKKWAKFTAVLRFTEEERWSGRFSQESQSAAKMFLCFFEVEVNTRTRNGIHRVVSSARNKSKQVSWCSRSWLLLSGSKTSWNSKENSFFVFHACMEFFPTKCWFYSCNILGGSWKQTETGTWKPCGEGVKKNKQRDPVQTYYKSWNEEVPKTTCCPGLALQSELVFHCLSSGVRKRIVYWSLP